MKQPAAKRYINAGEAQAKFGVSYYTLLKWYQRGILTAALVQEPKNNGGHRRLWFDVREVERVVNARMPEILTKQSDRRTRTSDQPSSTSR